MQIYFKAQFYYTKQENKKYLSEIREYELWGPFVFFLVFALTVALPSMNDLENIFTTVMLFLVLGISLIITNTKLLKNEMGVLQGFSMIGYLICPLVVASVYNCVLHILPFFLRAPVIVIAFLYSMRVSWEVFVEISSKDNYFMNFYPMALFEISLVFFMFYA